MRLASVWSWGWGTFSEAGRDPDKPTAACIYLWARSPSLCDGPATAGKAFKTSRTDGQLILPDGAMCTMGRSAIRLSAIARLNVLVKDRDVAYTALLARLAESANQPATTKEILAAERAVIQYRFGGSRSAYHAALGKAGAPLDVARGILGDSIRRQKVGRDASGLDAECGRDRGLLRVVSGAPGAHRSRGRCGAVVAERQADRARTLDVRAAVALRSSCRTTDDGADDDGPLRAASARRGAAALFGLARRGDAGDRRRPETVRPQRCSRPLERGAPGLRC